MVEMMTSLVGMTVVVMGMIIERRYEILVSFAMFIFYPIPHQKRCSNTFNATFAPSMHLVVTS
jgi:hypothetical protein